MNRWRVLAPILFGLAVLALWVLVTAANWVGEFALPAPATVVRRLISGINDGFLLAATAQTLREALLGCLFATLIGVPLGFAISRWRIFAATVEPYLAASQAIPAVAIAPLLVIWVGYGTTPIVALCTVMVIFPIVINTAIGIRSIDDEVVGAARLDGASGISLIFQIIFPLSAPYILAGLRNGFTLSVTGAVVGEMVIGGSRGLGIQLVTAQQLNDVPGMFATITILALTAVAIYAVLRGLENRVFAAVAER